MTIGISSMLGTAALLSLCLGLLSPRCFRRGGIVFWRIGSLGGSLYIARNREG